MGEKGGHAMARQKATETRLPYLIDGVVAGLLGGAAIALCFLLVDIANGQPLNAPIVLSALLFRLSAESGLSMGSLWQVLAYSIVHFGAFALLGFAMAWLVSSTKRASLLSLFIALFMAGSEFFFILLSMTAKAPANLSVSKWSLLVSNFVGVFVMVAYFFARNPGLGGNVFGSWFEVITEGIIAGVLGGLAVAIWFLLFDLSMGRPFYTPKMLGVALLGKGAAQGLSTMSAEVVFIYTVIHFSAFMLFGVIACSMLATFERNELLVGGLLLLFVIFELFFVGLLTLVDEDILRRLTRWKIEMGNLLATAVVISFLVMRNRQIWNRFLHGWRTLQTLAGDLLPKHQSNH